MSGLKKCSMCKSVLSRNDFYSYNGYSKAMCKACDKEYSSKANIKRRIAKIGIQAFEKEINTAESELRRKIICLQEYIMECEANEKTKTQDT